jgi:hypothetical protein
MSNKIFIRAHRSKELVYRGGEVVPAKEEVFLITVEDDYGAVVQNYDTRLELEDEIKTLENLEALVVYIRSYERFQEIGWENCKGVSAFGKELVWADDDDKLVDPELMEKCYYVSFPVSGNKGAYVSSVNLDEATEKGEEMIQKFATDNGLCIEPHCSAVDRVGFEAVAKDSGACLVDPGLIEDRGTSDGG